MKKKCSKCGIERPVEEFHAKKKSPDGRHSQCQFCIRKYWNEYYHRVMKPKKETVL